MEENLLTAGAVINKLFKSGVKIANAELQCLSGLSDSELQHFKTIWKTAEADLRIELINRLFNRSEEDFTLDYAAIFKSCIDDSEEKVRIKAIEGLELEDSYAYVTPLIQTLKTDESTEVRSAAARALVKFGLKAAMDELPNVVAQDIFAALLDVLENPKEPDVVKHRALEAIAPFRQEPVQQYIEDYYYSENPNLKAGAIYAMGRNCDHRWLEFIIDEMHSETLEFRFEAAQAAGELEDEDAVPYLIKLLNDEDPEVQEATIRSLGKIGGKEAKQALTGLTKSHDLRIKDAAKSALGELLSCEDPLSLNF